MTKTFRERRPWLVGVVAILGISAALGFAFSLTEFPALRGVYTIYADVVDAAGVQSGNEVRVAGVRVGRVTGIELRPNAARIELEIERDTQLPSATRVDVKLKTLLGQKFISLDVPLAGQVPDTGDLLGSGDVIPSSQTSVPFEIYQAANEGTAVLEELDKQALRKMIEVLGGTIGTSKQEIRRALLSVSDLTDVLDDKGPQISELLRNTEHLSRTLAESDEDLSGILTHGADVLEVLARRRTTISSLLQATDDLSANLAVLLRSVRGDVQLGVSDLASVLVMLEEEMDSVDAALQELDVSQALFAQGLRFGRFTEGTVCAVISEDTCAPEGTPWEPGLPVKGRQPEAGASVAWRAP